MPFAIEFSTESEQDFELIFDHLFESYLSFGESVEEALDHAMKRIFDIRRAAERLSSFPIRGTASDDILPGRQAHCLNTRPQVRSEDIRVLDSGINEDDLPSLALRASRLVSP